MVQFDKSLLLYYAEAIFAIDSKDAANSVCIEVYQYCLFCCIKLQDLLIMDDVCPSVRLVLSPASARATSA